MVSMLGENEVLYQLMDSHRHTAGYCVILYTC
jgi:hypothetical protein